MTLREFISRFILLCQQHDYEPQAVFEYLPQDELQWLADGESWVCFEHCLGLWKSQKLPREHYTTMPDITCNGCKHYSGNFCNRYEKTIPKTFNKEKACKEWTR